MSGSRRPTSIAATSYASFFAGIQPAVEHLYIRGENLEELLCRPKVAIVGSRKISVYGKQVTAQLAKELAWQGIVIVSGLAYGVDATAHRAALDAGGLTIAVLPSSVEEIYPAAHRGLAEQIVRSGGALLSEYGPGTPTMKHNFIGRNRIVSGMSDALLITEAAINSGTMHTARFALEQGKDVLAVPGNITSLTSAGTNNLIKSGATPVTSTQDVLDALGLKSTAATARRVRGSNTTEQLILNLLEENIADGNELLVRSELTTGEFNQALTMMEITGKIKSLGSNQWTLH
jgi:DNA processing protein